MLLFLFTFTCYNEPVTINLLNQNVIREENEGSKKTGVEYNTAAATAKAALNLDLF